MTQTGYLLLACNWSNQGNRSGGWLESRLQKEDFIQQGWKVIDDGALGGTLTTNESSREQTIFIRHVVKGEKYNLRCNKHDPPFIILLNGGGGPRAGIGAVPKGGSIFDDTSAPAVSPPSNTSSRNRLCLFDPDSDWYRGMARQTIRH